ncbi:MAG: hypothetical protein WDM91_23165 [Rhizomicrobium sp.]
MERRQRRLAGEVIIVHPPWQRLLLLTVAVLAVAAITASTAVGWERRIELHTTGPATIRTLSGTAVLTVVVAAAPQKLRQQIDRGRRFAIEAWGGRCPGPHTLTIVGYRTLPRAPQTSTALALDMAADDPSIVQRIRACQPQRFALDIGRLSFAHLLVSSLQRRADD